MQLDHNPKALVWKWRQNYASVNTATLNASNSENKVHIVKLTINDHLQTYQRPIQPKFLSLAPIKSVATLLGHPGDVMYLQVTTLTNLELRFLTFNNFKTIVVSLYQTVQEPS